MMRNEEMSGVVLTQPMSSKNNPSNDIIFILLELIGAQLKAQTASRRPHQQLLIVGCLWCFHSKSSSRN
ncbi:hypothetical protein TYRP_010881 [Tyrophagus putrescentiae]|nr:hypothetical protein TYRP_010881 [Tyrophagus putrescentiae]